MEISDDQCIVQHAYLYHKTYKPIPHQGHVQTFTSTISCAFALHYNRTCPRHMAMDDFFVEEGC